MLVAKMYSFNQGDETMVAITYAQLPKSVKKGQRILVQEISSRPQWYGWAVTIVTIAIMNPPLFFFRP